MKPLSAIEESLALSEWAVMKCLLCRPAWTITCSAAKADPWAGDVDALVRVLSRKGLLRTVSR